MEAAALEQLSGFDGVKANEWLAPLLAFGRHCRQNTKNSISARRLEHVRI
jgi:hypothetical protein